MAEFWQTTLHNNATVSLGVTGCVAIPCWLLASEWVSIIEHTEEHNCEAHIWKHSEFTFQSHIHPINYVVESHHSRVHLWQKLTSRPLFVTHWERAWSGSRNAGILWRIVESLLPGWIGCHPKVLLCWSNIGDCIHISIPSLIFEVTLYALCIIHLLCTTSQRYQRWHLHIKINTKRIKDRVAKSDLNSTEAYFATKN